MGFAATRGQLLAGRYHPPRRRVQSNGLEKDHEEVTVLYFTKITGGRGRNLLWEDFACIFGLRSAEK
jgi:hypothetical protein